jgi:uncharacterized membrane protein YeiH
MSWHVRKPDVRVMTRPRMKVTPTQSSGENLDNDVALVCLWSGDVNDAGYSPEGLVQNGTHQPSIPQTGSRSLHYAVTARRRESRDRAENRGGRMDLNAESFSEILRFVDLSGVFANAILGGIAARTARLDIVGFVILAILSGLGGGIIRDTLLQQGPPVALTDPAYLALAITGAVVAFFVPFRGQWSQRSLLLLDALAIGSWAAVGAQKTLDAGLGWLAAIAMGIVTAVGGGAVRDVMLLRIPRIFGGNTLYATSALVSSVEMVVFSALGMPTLGSLVAMASGAGLSLLARRYGWTLPTEVRIPRPRLMTAVGRRFRRRQGTDAPDAGGEPPA